MNKLVLGLSLAGSLLLSACSDSGPKEPIIPGGATSGSTTLLKPIFAPGDGELPIPNDLLFNGTTDLTLNIPVADPNDLSDPKVALNGLDGWSAIAPFAISFRDESTAAGQSGSLDLDPATVIPGQTVRLFKVNVLRSEVMPGIIAPTGPVTGVQSELQPGVDFVAQYTGPLTIGVIPLKPLESQASYMVVLTNGIKDTAGNAVVPDGQYNISKATTPLSGVTAALEPVRQLVNAMENAAVAFDAGLTRDDIVLSFQFTVQSIPDALAAAKAVYVDAAPAPSTSFSSLGTDTLPFTGLGAADLYKGSIDLKYMLTAPSMTDPTANLDKFWTAASMVPDGQGGMVPNPAAGGNLTYANPLPEVTGVESVPLLVSMPKAQLGCAKPANGYPVLIFQHGITRDRTDMLGIADTMAAPPLCTAVVSMDMPLHGMDANNPVHLGLMQATGGMIGLFEGYGSGTHERTFGVDFVDNTTGAPGPDGLPDTSGKHFINLTNLRVSRDNLREAIFDLLQLAKAVPTMDIDGDSTPDFDPANISFMGHSLGGIAGTGFVAYADTIKDAVLANPGGGILGLLDASPTFGPVIRAGLASAGVMAGTPEYAAFLFAAQTVADAGDPANLASMAVARQTPIYLLQVNGDTVVPNSSPTAPLSGTIPLANLLQLNVLAPSQPGTVMGSRFWARFNTGLHSTVLSPDDGQGNPVGLLNVTTEMQTQIGSFVGSGGTAVTVADETLLQ